MKLRAIHTMATIIFGLLILGGVLFWALLIWKLLPYISKAMSWFDVAVGIADIIGVLVWVLFVILVSSIIKSLIEGGEK